MSVPYYERSLLRERAILRHGHGHRHGPTTVLKEDGVEAPPDGSRISSIAGKTLVGTLWPISRHLWTPWLEVLHAKKRMITSRRVRPDSRRHKTHLLAGRLLRSCDHCNIVAPTRA